MMSGLLHGMFVSVMLVAKYNDLIAPASWVHVRIIYSFQISNLFVYICDNTYADPIPTFSYTHP
jgi:hypothetical protein